MIPFLQKLCRIKGQRFFNYFILTEKSYNAKQTKNVKEKISPWKVASK